MNAVIKLTSFRRFSFCDCIPIVSGKSRSLEKTFFHPAKFQYQGRAEISSCLNWCGEAKTFLPLLFFSLTRFCNCLLSLQISNSTNLCNIGDSSEKFLQPETGRFEWVLFREASRKAFSDWACLGLFSNHGLQTF